MHPEPYAELHLHTCYSFLDGASQPEELAARAALLGYTALAITDHDGLHGAMAFAQACKAVGIRPITGVELTLRRGLLDETGKEGAVHLTLLAESDAGYANLCRLITLAHRDTRLDPHGPTAPSLDPALLAGHTEGLIALSGCREGEASRLVGARRFAEADAALRRLTALFGEGNTFVELQHNLVKGDTRRVARLCELAEHLGLPVVATGNVHYHDRARHRLQDALVAIRHRSTLEASHHLRRPNSRFYLRPQEEVRRAFSDHPEAVRNASWIAERCRDFDLSGKTDLGYHFPDFARGEGEGAVTADEVLAAHCREKFPERYPEAGTDAAILDRARAQLAAELALVAKHGLAGFFLIYRDLQVLATEVAKDVRGAGTVRGGSGLPPGRGRGSSVSSIICYLIGLSHVDPIKHKLFFRRFLNEDLRSIPDIDLDFARDIRAELILRVHERYGREHAALVCLFATYQVRSAVRDLGKVLGLPPAQIDKLARLSEGGGADTVRKELDRLPEFRGQADGPLWAHLAELAAQLDGMPRHVGQHVGGMIISSKPIVEMVPVQPSAMPGRAIVQWDKDGVDDARFVKIDFLALGMLSLVEECLELVWQHRGEKVDLGGIPYDDAATYEMISQGDTVGLFQVESRAQIQMLTRTQPRSLDDLAVQVAIVRPGPIVGGAVHPYVARRERLRRDASFRARADHPLLDELLRDTLGVVLYQDQVLEVAIALAGFSAGQADGFRRSMSRRRSRGAMEGYRRAFLAGAAERGVAEGEADAIFDKLCGFSAFGFPKSHSYAFAVLAYQSAWLRRCYPEEYYAALLNNQPMGFYAPHVLVGDAKRHGLQVLPVSINASGARAAPRDGAILLGLGQVRGLGEELAAAIVEERALRGPYTSLADLLRRAGLPRRVAERLVAVGALGEFGLGRRELLWQLGLLLPTPSKARSRTAVSPRLQMSLDLPTEQDMVRLPDMDAWERMVADYGLLGLSPSYHPLALMRPTLPAGLRTAEQLRTGRDGARARTAGLVVCRQRPGTAKGHVFLLLEDETGLLNVVVRPALYEAERATLRGEAYLWVEGVMQIRSGTVNLIAARVAPLARVPAHLQPAGRGGAAATEDGPEQRFAGTLATAGRGGLPRPPLQHGSGGRPGDAREVPVAAATALGALRGVSPPSYDFR